MKNLKRILVGIDYSDCSENALCEAARLANQSDGKLICLHVFDDEVLEEFQRYESFDRPAVIEEAQRRLETFVADKLGAGHDIECVVRVGHPFKELLHGVSDWKADLLVLGSRGFNQRDERRTGVFASRCIRKAPVAVMLVRKHQRDPFTRVVACVDFSATSDRAIVHALEIAEQSGSKLELLHVFMSPLMIASDAYGFGPTLPPIDTAETKRILEDRLNSLADRLGADFPKVEITTQVQEGASIARTIVERLEECGADLVVLGTRGRTGLKSLLMGTTAEKLIHETPCSALAIKPEGFHYEVD
ncbi:MAG: universal stress protein [Verrucomicrobia bacterium]|nr:universal stress protein [Verrucomicrobiota bacterium]